MADDGQLSTVAQVFKIIMDATLSFHDKSPIVASIGYLLIASAPTLMLVLRWANKNKKLDNERIISLHDKGIVPPRSGG